MKTDDNRDGTILALATLIGAILHEMGDGAARRLISEALRSVTTDADASPETKRTVRQARRFLRELKG